MTRSFDRGGFTIIELMVALAIAGMVLVGARTMMVQLADSGERVALLSRASARSLNSEAWLRGTLLQIGAQLQGESFVGYPRSVEFHSWCDRPVGWAEPCRIRMALDEQHRLLASIDDQGFFQVLEPMTIARFLYLRLAGEHAYWRADWIDAASPPSALGMVTRSDTLIFRIGFGPRR